MKKKTPRRWSAGYWEGIGERFTFTEEQRQQVRATLPAGNHAKHTLDSLQDEVKRSLGYSENMERKPPAHVKKELRAIAQQTKALLLLLQRVHEDTTDTVDFRLARQKGPFIADLLATLKKFGIMVDELSFTYTQKTGRRVAPLSVLIGQLIFWWENQFDTEADCEWNREAEEYEGAFYTFVVGILDLVYGPNGYGKSLYSYRYPATRDKSIFRAVRAWNTKMSENDSK